jgi:uncharacterized protein YkwD
MRLRWFLALAILLGWLLWLTPTLYPVTAPIPTAHILTFPTLPDAPDPNGVFNVVNQSREAQGLPALIADTYLTKIAHQRAADMAARHYYAHRDAEGRIFSDLLAADGEAVVYGCENLDLEFTLTPEIYVKDWLRSPKHQACMFNKQVTRAGYAVARVDLVQSGGQTNTAYVVVAIHATEPVMSQLASQ